MTEIEKIKRYIARTGVGYKDTSPYHMSVAEAFALADMGGEMNKEELRADLMYCINLILMRCDERTLQNAYHFLLHIEKGGRRPDSEDQA